MSYEVGRLFGVLAIVERTAYMLAFIIGLLVTAMLFHMPCLQIHS